MPLAHAPNSLMIVVELCFGELGFQDECVGDRNQLAGRKPADDLQVSLVLASRLHHAFGETGLGTNEQHRLTIDELNRRFRYHDLRRLALQRYVGGNE